MKINEIIAQEFVTKNLRGVREGVDIGREWMTDTELDQYVPDDLEQEWRELVGYDEDGNAHPLWANMTGDYEPDASDPQHRAWMVRVANKWFEMKKIPNVRFFDVRDLDDELEWLVQIGDQGVSEGSYTTEKQILTRIRQIMYDRKLSGTKSNSGELLRLKQQLKDLRSQQGVAEGQAGKEDLRKEIVDILERIYFDASSDDDMTDVIADQLGDYYQAVKVSGDAVLQRVYANMRDTADEPPEFQATVALAGIKKLMDPGYRPQPRPPLSPEQNAQVDAFVNQFKAALASHGIRAHPDWNKGKSG